MVVERPIEEVSAFAGDPTNAPAWRRGVASAEWETAPPTMLGSRLAVRERLLGRAMVRTYEIVELTPRSQVSMRATDGPFPMRTTVTWRPLSARATHVVLRVSVEPRGAARIAAPLLSFTIRRAADRDIVRLKRLLETRSTR